MSRTNATKVIDIERSYIPVDPMSFPESMHNTGAEDTPEKRIPVIPYDGYNFMPTGYGYQSYFGINSIMDIDPLASDITPFTPKNCDELFIVQTNTYQNILVALCEDGIWTKYAGASGAWSQVITLDAPDSGEHLNWTYCVIGNCVFMYRAGGDYVYRMEEANSWIPTGYAVTSLNMSGQLGIFKAGGRLGLWDSENSIAWTDPDDQTDATPSLTTGAGATIFQQIIGRISAVRQHGNGFVIYATRSIVFVQRTTDAYQFWSAVSIFNENGCSYLHESAQGQPDTQHFAFTTFGIVKIENGQAEYIVPEVFSYLKEKRQPVYLRLLEGRFLFFQVLDQSYITGNVQFDNEGIDSSQLTFKGANYSASNPQVNLCKAFNAVDKYQEGIYLNTTFAYQVPTQATVPGSVPIWELHISTVMPIADIKGWYNTLIPSSDYFADSTFDRGGIVAIDGTNIYPIPQKGPMLVANYMETLLAEDFDGFNGLFNKQDMLFAQESAMMRDWLYAIEHSPQSVKSVTVLFPTNNINLDLPLQNPFYIRLIPTGSLSEHFSNLGYSSGPYIDLSLQSEANKYYGISESKKTAWLQRSLTRGVNIITTAITTPILVNQRIAQWRCGGVYDDNDFPSPVFNTFAAAIAGGASVRVAAASNFPFDAPYGVPVVSLSDMTLGDNIPPRILFAMSKTTGGILTVVYNPYDGVAGTFIEIQSYVDYYDAFNVTIEEPAQIIALAAEIYINEVDFEQRFYNKTNYTYYPNCTYKQLGFTKIKGHGHYEISGAFDVDDSTPEEADYTDICIPTPPKRKKVPNWIVGGTITDIPAQSGEGCLDNSVTIDGQSFSYPSQSITLPSTSFLLQDGSIEPIYPTFPGAFVYDLQYKKWGKMFQDHKQLLNYSPINTHAGDGPIPFDIFSVSAGCLLSDGTIAIFDKFPADSIIKYGKIGFYRNGYTDCEGVTVQFRTPATGAISLEGSLDGKLINPAISQIQSYENVVTYDAGFESSAHWFNVCIQGYYDIKNIDFRGWQKGKR